MIEICASCGTTREQTFGEPTGHSYQDGFCTNCGEPYYTEGLEIIDCGYYAAVSGLGSFSGGELIIPASYNGLPVTVIYAGIFRGNSTITSLSIPGSIERLDSNLFEECSALEKVIIGEGMTEIGGYAFSNCTALKYVTLPATLTKISGGVFYGCSSLEMIELGASLDSIGANAFMNCTALTEITLPGSLTYLGDSAFSGCEKLTTVYNYSMLTEIPSGAFRDCSSLDNIDLAQIYTVGGEAFWCC
jgi:hypothetical protein